MQNIDLKFLAIPDFYKSNAEKEIDENGLISKIQSIKPEIAFMMICYSEINDIKFLLEGAGIFAKMRRNHDLNILSNGKILTMNEIQKKFIQDIAHEDNVEKDVVITGPVGSGKTLLGLEAINIKKAHYLKKYQKDKSSPLWDKTKLRVIILIGSTGYENTMLKQQLENENLKDTNDCELEIATVHPDSRNLTSIFQGKENHESFSHTLIMLDEITR